MPQLPEMQGLFEMQRQLLNKEQGLDANDDVE